MIDPLSLYCITSVEHFPGHRRWQWQHRETGQESKRSFDTREDAERDAMSEQKTVQTESCRVYGALIVFPEDDDPQFLGDTCVTSLCRHVIFVRNLPPQPSASATTETVRQALQWYAEQVAG